MWKRPVLGAVQSVTKTFFPAAPALAVPLMIVPVGVLHAQDLQLGGLECLRQVVLGPQPDGVDPALLQVHADPVLIPVGVPVVAEDVVHLGSRYVVVAPVGAGQQDLASADSGG